MRTLRDLSSDGGAELEMALSEGDGPWLRALAVDKHYLVEADGRRVATLLFKMADTPTPEEAAPEDE